MSDLAVLPMTPSPAQASGGEPALSEHLPENPWPARALDLVTDVSKQVITLSTGMIALGIAFLDLGIDVRGAARWTLLGSWAVFILAIGAAILTLLACIGHQSQASPDAPPDAYADNLRIFGAAQLILFAVGLLLTGVAAGVVAFR